MSRIAKFSYHKSAGQFYVKLDGKFIYLGKNEKSAQLAYFQLMATRTQKADLVPYATPALGWSVEELAVTYLESVKERYERTRSFEDYRQAGRLLVELYGRLNASMFGIVHFESIKKAMAAKGWSMRTANARIDVIKRIFHYGVINSIIDGQQYFNLKAVSRFRQSDMVVTPPRKIPPVPVDIVLKTVPFLPSMVADMVLLQLYSGTRAGDICGLTFAEVDTSPNNEGVWIYRPTKHKTACHGKKRSIFFGKRCQDILSKYMGRADIAEYGPYVFSPAAAMKAIRESRSKPGTSSKQSRRKAKPKRFPGSFYPTSSYTHAIKTACERAIEAGAIAKDDKWTSHQLRHTAATLARSIGGLEGAQVYLGHSHASTTEIYAETNEAKGRQIAAAIG